LLSLIYKILILLPRLRRFLRKTTVKMALKMRWKKGMWIIGLMNKLKNRSKNRSKNKLRLRRGLRNGFREGMTREEMGVEMREEMRDVRMYRRERLARRSK
jgi:hypothetical protein